MLSDFKPWDSKPLRQIRKQAKFQGRLNSDYTASVVGENNQVNFKVCIMNTICKGRFEFVLVFLPVKVWVPNKIWQPRATQCHLLTSSAVLSHVHKKLLRCNRPSQRLQIFRKWCRNVTLTILCVFIKFVLNLTARDRILCIQNI